MNTMTLYINYEERKVYTEAGMQKKIDEAINELSVKFDEFLVRNYSYVELFNMDKQKKAEVFDAYVDYAKEAVKYTRQAVEFSFYHNCCVVVIDLEKGTILSEEFY